ncbi:MAG TPA: outer membrane beta-barrel protein [Casimicrobiaceae bacterium]|nr:outer membrane beta-barrel protein [Casimicrobiaceae bacterium]
MKKQALAYVSAVALALGASALAHAQVVAPAGNSTSGFYGGVALRDAGTDRPSFGIHQPTSLWGKYSFPTTDDAGSRALLVGGYRWQNDLALEASVATTDRYALRPHDVSHGGVGLSLQAPTPDAGSRSFQADLYGSWSPRPSLSLYSRLGYAQNPLPNSYLSFNTPTTDPRRTREGVNYGLGLRYDVSSALGLRLEYARFGRFAGEAPSSGFLPESDQVQLGVQLRF